MANASAAAPANGDENDTRNHSQAGEVGDDLNLFNDVLATDDSALLTPSRPRNFEMARMNLSSLPHCKDRCASNCHSKKFLK